MAWRQWINRGFLIEKVRILWNGLNKEIPLDKIGYVATLFWIFATVGPRLVDPKKYPKIGDFTYILESGQVLWLSAGIALVLHIGVPIIYVVLKRPFYISSTWYPVEWAPEVHKGKYNGYLRMPDSEQVEIMIPIDLLSGVDSYELKFDVTEPFELELQDKNKDQKWDRDEKILSTNDATHHIFIPRIKIKESGEVGSGDNYQLTITDIHGTRDTDVLELNIRD